jgi:endonuclease G
VQDDADVLSFMLDGRKQRELKYEHFSVVMSKSRRFCRYSAANIDGSQPRKIKRPGWRRDPRIRADQQVDGGCYGSPPRFSRGHMTRREDPIWGTPESAARGNSDSMHVTNAVPQMQVFNAGIWLGLENYALENARHDRMRISVFTGPVLRDDDRTRFGVQIPTTFWKVIAFEHDETHELCATGYTLAQDDFIPTTSSSSAATRPRRSRWRSSSRWRASPSPRSCGASTRWRAWRRSRPRAR